ncbi:MAG TPA: hypothetical protein VLA17_17600 [Candidatus Limnocylindria bacterium]|nr:hypothetical protein [Candidatus Limnocylindria bacterium]
MREIPLALVDPFIKRIELQREKLPVARIVTGHDKLRRAAITQRESRSVGIDPRTATVANRQPHAPFRRRIDAIKTRLLRGHRRSRSINLKIFTTAIKLNQSNENSSLKHTQRDSFITQRDNAYRRSRRQPHKISRINLYLQPAFFIGRNGVAFDEWIIQASTFPILVAKAFETHFSGDHADTYNSCFYVVIFGIVVRVSSSLGRDSD